MHWPHWFPVHLLRPLGWMLVHALWQVGLIALLYQGLAISARGAAPRWRYRLACAALAASLVVPIGTFVAISSGAIARPTSAIVPGPEHQHENGPAKATTGVARLASAVPVPHAASDRSGSRRSFESLIAAVDLWMPWVVGLWVAGTALGIAGLGMSWIRVQILARQSTDAVPRAVSSLMQQLRARLRVRRRVALRRSNRVDSPAQVGWARPVILLPSAAARLHERSLEPVLAHELAHIRRHDYLINLLQSLAERLMFFQPAFRWMSEQARRERELCCDELAARCCEGGALAYARGLARLEAMRVGPPALAMADDNLLARVRRLVDPRPAPRPGAAPVLMALLAGLALLGLTVELAAESSAPTVLDGLDPVQLLAGNRVAGRASEVEVWEGYRYRFVDAASRAEFLRDPRRFAVRNIEICPVSGRHVRGDVFRVVDGQILLFCCPHAPEQEAQLRRVLGRMQAREAGN